MGSGASGARPTDSAYRGARLGLPEAGPGSVAPSGSRAGAFIVDLVVCTLIGGLGALVDATPLERNLIGVVAVVLLYTALLPATGQTYGMRLLRIKVQRVSGGLLGLGAALVRGLLVAALVPALFTDRDGRGIHDRLVHSVVVRR